ncbi:transmembrane E3 ubiquitin-protein ligase 1-like isoform X2 [Phalaenopsis equestris]|uniref:transmembrane E3 ubiquitin-protein ligase 1-like isoform X1 n=1 Tax=Phalaenopsis equestris TaxID=78828 RepID=UPI0009E1F7DE|nr:transmembrane E3 ubiquitin-protein ligase 1-like isoform X1 [Phalaenopsis equestris]XP_020574029.1 transmembrane E3 ubiquitin-protein ligase 1-like isoform X1 [Phalaenopsis equestris]XP_020574030.1 transmembrane E3 ubiquitin-protein ligase 1-like isoform X1 [Phalaenopsis equestris]XP_020574031.1 transmembrane E3 ubiquitin-protein ligase 1-like isoform X2 [Phalaenopsis equestris]
MILIRRRFGAYCGVLAALWFFFAWVREAASLRPLRDRGPSASTSWGEEQIFFRSGGNDPTPYSRWNITGTYKGKWSFAGTAKRSSRFLDFGKSNGMSVLELASTPTKINGVHYVQGAVIFHDVHNNENDLGAAQMRVEGVYIWPFRQLRLVASSGSDAVLLQEAHFMSNPYHLLGAFSSQIFQESPRDTVRKKISITDEIEKHCNIEISAHVSRISSRQADGEHDCYHLEGLMESPVVEDDGECFSPILINATSLNVEVYYNKAVNYTLMVTFISFLQVLLLIRQMEHSNTQSGAAKVSIVMIGQQAIMDAYLCLLHLTAGILVESLFNAFATAAFFKFVVFSIFEMRYLLAIWKASRPLSNGEGWEAMRRELSVLYSRFYGILLGGILIMYEFHSLLRPILFIMYSFWIPQIINNVIRDTRKPMHPHYILGMSVTRLAIPLYMFGCPNNFMRIEVDRSWCISLCIFMGFQALILILQHFLGSRWFIPHQILPEKYSYNRRLENNTHQATDCVICMTAIDLTQRSSDYMVTPCDHFFHSGCLQRWMDIKMECPTCRRSLPPA